MSIKYEPSLELLLITAKPPSARRAGSMRLFQLLDLYWRSPETGDGWFISRLLKKAIFFPSEGSWVGVISSANTHNLYAWFQAKLLHGYFDVTRQDRSMW